MTWNIGPSDEHPLTFWGGSLAPASLPEPTGRFLTGQDTVPYGWTENLDGPARYFRMGRLAIGGLDNGRMRTVLL